MLEPVTLKAPSAWASFLVNGDGSNLADGEADAILNWLERQGMDWPVDCADFGYSRHHDAWEEFPYFTGCQTYTFLISRP